MVGPFSTKQIKASVLDFLIDFRTNPILEDHNAVKDKGYDC